jgi:superfamily I DNA and/or RNA helicase
MNVAVTRAKRLSIVVGDSVTIARHPFYKDFLEYVELKGAYRSAYEF